MTSCNERECENDCHSSSQQEDLAYSLICIRSSYMVNRLFEAKLENLAGYSLQSGQVIIITERLLWMLTSDNDLMTLHADGYLSIESAILRDDHTVSPVCRLYLIMTLLSDDHTNFLCSRID